ncbi:hypothetical protein JGB96_23445, partial [Salmonella enterica subsp. enterica serovar Derby]|nr:hypothetical protein [Salmonella enterica subsp. enterica serovar Derby]
VYKEKQSKTVNVKSCESCVNSKREIAYLNDTLEIFSKGKKQLNMILDKSKTPYMKQGLGYNYAQDNSKGIQILKNGLVEFDTQPAKITFKSAGFAQPSVQSKRCFFQWYQVSLHPLQKEWAFN